MRSPVHAVRSAAGPLVACEACGRHVLVVETALLLGADGALVGFEGKSFHLVAPDIPLLGDELGAAELRALLGAVAGHPVSLRRCAKRSVQARLDGIPRSAQDLDNTGVGLVESLTDLDGGGLASAVGAEEPEALPRAGGEVEAIDGNAVAGGLADRNSNSRDTVNT